MKVIIHKENGKCITAKEFSVQAGKLLGQSAESVEFALSFMEAELGLVDAMELYCKTCGIKFN